jgi:hypothetical protein
MAHRKTAKAFQERKYFRITYRQHIPRLEPSALLVHRVPFVPDSPYPHDRLVVDAEGGFETCPAGQFAECEPGKIISPDRARVQPWPPVYLEDKPDESVE